MSAGDYTTAPACDLVATTCAACGRPLLDAASVECGMGPHCRRRAGLTSDGTGADWTQAREILARARLEAVGEDARATANRVVARIAADQSAPVVPVLLSALTALGFAGVAEAVREHLRPACVEVLPEGERAYAVRVEGIDRHTFAALVDALRRVPGRRYDGERKVSVVPVTSRAALWQALRDTLRSGTTLVTARGVATI